MHKALVCNVLLSWHVHHIIILHIAHHLAHVAAVVVIMHWSKVLLHLHLLLHHLVTWASLRSVFTTRRIVADFATLSAVFLSSFGLALLLRHDRRLCSVVEIPRCVTASVYYAGGVVVTYLDGATAKPILDNMLGCSRGTHLCRCMIRTSLSHSLDSGNDLLLFGVDLWLVEWIFVFA